MTFTNAFRVATYGALVASCVALGYSEWDLLPEGAVFAALVSGVLVALYFNESRFELSLAEANRVGLGIGVVAVAWLAYQFLNSESLIYTLPWPASLLPYLGPLLMVLIPAKLIRPKHEGDWWAMQGIGLAGATLAGAMAEDAVVGVLLGVYLIVAAVAMTLFFVARASGGLTPIPGRVAVTPAETVGRVGATARGGLVWVVGAAMVALPMFFLTPRSESNRWQFGRPGLETGYSGGQSVDLNRVGELYTTNEVAFRVVAEDGRGLTLPPDQRWRGRSYTKYQDGLWTPADGAGGSFVHELSQQMKTFRDDPALRPGGRVLTFTVASGNRSADPVLADPVFWVPGGPSPVAVPSPPGGQNPWYQTPDTSFRVPPRLAEGMARYSQFFRTAYRDDRDLGPGFVLRPQSLAAQLAPFTAAPKSAAVRRWVVQTLTAAAETDPPCGQAVADITANGVVPQERFETVARALARRLADPREYAYTTRLVRRDRAVDPVEEFLTATKSGHCQRYAAGLALALRSVGVPCQYVLGFKGWDADPDDGRGIVVRQDHAHAWVEVLVPRPARDDFPRPKPGTPTSHPTVWHWLSVDPTPTGGAATGVADRSWLEAASHHSRTFFSDFVLGNRPELRAEAFAAVKSWLAAAWLPVGVALCLAAAAVALPRVRSARRAGTFASGTPAVGHAVYAEWLAVLARAGVVPDSGETPREFADRVTGWIQGRGDGQTELPQAMLDLLTRERFAGAAGDDSADAGHRRALAGFSRTLAARPQ